MLKMPVKFLRAVAKDAGIRLTKQFGVGNVFLSTDPALAAAAKTELEQQLAREGLKCAGWRIVPTGPDACGRPRPCERCRGIEQLFVNTRRHSTNLNSTASCSWQDARAELAREHADPVFYLPSLSVSTIVYKGMVMPPHLSNCFRTWATSGIEASVAVFHQRFSTNTLPQWKLAHPFRYLAHNGEINTIEANRSWAVARGPILKSPLLPELHSILPLVSLEGSDSQSLDNMLECC